MPNLMAYRTHLFAKILAHKIALHLICEVKISCRLISLTFTNPAYHQYFYLDTLTPCIIKLLLVLLLLPWLLLLKTNFHKIKSNLTHKAVMHDYKYQLIRSLTHCHLTVIITKHTNTLTVMAARGKRSSYTITYKLQEVDYAKKHGNRATTRAFGPPPTEIIIGV